VTIYAKLDACKVSSSSLSVSLLAPILVPTDWQLIVDFGSLDAVVLEVVVGMQYQRIRPGLQHLPSQFVNVSRAAANGIAFFGLVLQRLEDHPTKIPA
jgi:hypothetical protein